MGPDQTVEMMRKVLMEAMMLSAPLLVAACAGEPGGESSADADQRAGADPDHRAEAGSRLCRDDGDAALDGASAGELYGAHVYRLSQVSGIGAA